MREPCVWVYGARDDAYIDETSAHLTSHLYTCVLYVCIGDEFRDSPRARACAKAERSGCLARAADRTRRGLSDVRCHVSILYCVVCLAAARLSSCCHSLLIMFRP